MRELGRMFRTYCHTKHSNWPQYVPYIEWTLNNVRHESTHHIPSEIFLKQFQYNPLTQFIQFPSEDILPDYNRKLMLANEIQISKSEARKKRHEKKLCSPPFKVNDLFFLFYDGPTKIINIRSVNAYELVHPEDHTPKGTHNEFFCDGTTRKNVDGTFSELKPHSRAHIANRDDESNLIVSFRDALKERSKNENISLKLIYDDEAQRHRVAAGLYPSSTAESIIRSVRRSSLPGTSSASIVA
ncbi:Transposon Ty3-G Gag-Pol polyprotein [Aphis craccivora]|uniref:Transposon Ty3-G Gag-Pol polyprotein n=1 Tax=Aphis craccivora TaxID=307492 RepID=A0A6G0XWP3_APHCR|nr:Transposon Ty3-G Gag-Pol polyprotein [Aphis craccivora]